MGAFARAMDRLAEWVRWLAEAVRLLKPRQSPQNAQGVLEAFLNDVPVDERTEDELRAEGVPVDDIKDTEEREHGAAEEEVPGEQAGDEGDAGSASGADNASASVDGVVEGTGETRVGGKEGAEQAQTGMAGRDVGGEAVRTETREERLERRKRQRREANEMRERMNRLMKKNRKYGGRRMSVEVPGSMELAQLDNIISRGEAAEEMYRAFERGFDTAIPMRARTAYLPSPAMEGLFKPVDGGDQPIDRIAYPFGYLIEKNGKLDANNGFLHIVLHRMQAGASLEEAVDVAVRVGEAIIESKTAVLQYRNNKPQYILEHNGYVAVISKEGSVITGWKKDGSGAGRDLQSQSRVSYTDEEIRRLPQAGAEQLGKMIPRYAGEKQAAFQGYGAAKERARAQEIADIDEELQKLNGQKEALKAKGKLDKKEKDRLARINKKIGELNKELSVLKGVKFSTEKPGDEGLSATVRSVREALQRDGDKAVELLGGTILSNYVREETDAALRKRVARAAVERLFNVIPVSEERLRQAGLIEETLALPEDEDEVASEYEDAKIVDARNRLAHGGVLVGESQAEAVVRARAKQVLGKTFRYLFEVYHGTPHAGWTRWERGHGGTTGLGYAYFAPRVITAAEYADTYGAPNDGLTDVKDMQRYGISEAVYHMVVGMNNPLIVDCRRASWNNIRMKNKRTVRTDEILNVARFGELGYDGVIFLNVHDSQLSVKLHGYDVDVVPLGPVMKSGKNGDVAKQMKSLDGVTVSDVDVPEFFGAIDIRDRFDVRDPDIRWSTEKPGDAARPSFSATAEGRRVVAGILDNLMRFQEDLVFSNPAVEQQRADYGNAAVGKWNRRTREANDKKPGRGERGRAREVYLYLVLSERASLGLKTSVY